MRTWIAVVCVLTVVGSAIGAKIEQTAGKPVDPTLAALEAEAKKQHGRAMVIERTVRKYQPETRPELIVRKARQSYQERLDAARDAVKVEAEKRVRAEEDARLAKDLQKAAKRSDKNLAKVRKALEQSLKKATDDDEAAVYLSILAILDAGGE